MKSVIAAVLRISVSLTGPSVRRRGGRRDDP
ncbi:hypothetical protein Ae168Ps1_1664c [Pseudonocardia sp. Ae168_Ps1]|nr:hypothetical protein Ae150APs1_1658c [Pseudonocardia sp. Ae150A_Ps1]OLL79258.1 hypothetical protein Ae168Ps1_1664c [Pseudonocardia sp. Ae168_Ps1]OLL86604.1 hypothetical protein Ae263Ps1_3659 [Pseudonocardia sp. Ae263_Ps1]OLL93348.1 hypothetical protein Ae356Ps1_3245c [Pseudonocardia sp. Ae356_Ps1]